ncbi:MAG: glycosyltransferase [Deltaproteobacteria bacterium]|nr:glycosyltransferase [Deltaproteobacteria bacterium]
MSRLLFAVIAERGHLFPMLGPAMHLRDRGHDVHVYAEGPVDAPIEAAGLRRWPAVYPVPPQPYAGAEFSRRVRDPAWLRRWITTILLGGVAEQVPRIEAVIDELQPDAVIVDPMLYAAAIAAHRKARPWACVSNSLNPALPDDLDSDLLRTVAALTPGRAAMFQQYGMQPRFRGCDLLSPRLTVCFGSRTLVGTPPAGVTLVGASLPPQPREPRSDIDWEALRDRPVLYMSLGSQVFHQPRMFKRVATAARALNVRVVASTGQLDPRPLGPWPAGSILRPWLPQLEVLPHAAVMVSHGGANSVVESLAHGVPLLVSPICNDQFHQAELLRRADLGRIVDLHTASQAACTEALQALLHPSVRERLHGCMPGDGASAAADRLEAWLAAP